jgi:arabinose-5-phosphate isomerase
MSKILKIAKQVIEQEIEAIQALVKDLDSDFESVVNCILESNGRLIITGIGKSALIAKKIVATLNSTGTPSIFMHAADAIHGDLGIIQPDDVVLCISKSGNTPEIKMLIPLIKERGNTLIGMSSNQDSFLAQNSDFNLKTIIEREACPNNLVPTSSTTAQLVMGDALAVTLIETRGFTEKDFAKHHPGGSLGKRLYLRVEGLSLFNERPEVKPDDSIRKTILEISSKRLGATAVIDKNKVVGIITDGDLRRMMQKHSDVDGLLAKDIMTKNPKCLDKTTLAADALKIMKENNITQILVTDNDEYFGVIHLHDILKEGIL